MKRSIFSFCSFICVWWILSITINHHLLLPDPWSVFLTMIEQIGQASFQRQLMTSLKRVVLCFGLAILISLVLVFLGRWKGWVRNTIDQLMAIIQVIPSAALTLLLLLFLGQIKTIVFMVVIMVMPLLVTTLHESLDRIQREYEDVLLVYPASLWDTIFKIYFPLLKSSLLSMVQIGFILTIKIVVTAEVLVSVASGLGRGLTMAKFNLEMTEVFAYVAWIVLIALLFKALIQWWQSKTKNWIVVSQSL